MEKFMNFKLWGISSIILLILVGISFLWLWNYPLRKDNNKIQADMIEKTPIGTTFNEVLKRLESMNFKPKISNNTGFLKQEGGLSKTIGVSSIRVHLGDYWKFPFFRTSVTAFWGFDETGRLIEIWIWKTTDSP